MLHGDDFVLDGFYRTLDEPPAGAPGGRRSVSAATSTSTRTTPDSTSRRMSRSSGILTEGARFLAAEQRIMTPCIVVRRSVYEQLGGFDDRLACAEDWEMWVRVASHFPVYYEERRSPATGCTGTRTPEEICEAGAAWTTRG